MVATVGRRKVNQERLRLLVAEGLLLRHKPDLLEDSELAEAIDLRSQSMTTLWPRGDALARALESAGRDVSQLLGKQDGYEAHKSLLDAVLAGSSIAAWAKCHNRRREHVSRTLWKTVSRWVARRLAS